MSARTATSTPELVASGNADPCGLEEATVAVLMGGRSSERDVSLTSGRRVLEALSTPSSGTDRRGPRRVIAVEIQPDGRWLFGQRVRLPGEAIVALADVDVFFLALHGGEGENGVLQGFLTCSDLAFTGSGVIASAVAMDKGFARELVRTAGVRVPAAVGLSRDRWPRADAALDALAEQGCVVKPRRGGSSVGCSIVRGRAELAPALERAFEEGPDVLVEAFVRGVEVTGGVIEVPPGSARDAARDARVALPPVEIRPRGAFFDYHEKYADDGALELCPPERIGAAACDVVRARALDAHRALGCAGYSRTDFIVPADGGEPVYLETNTLPGLTPRSLLPRAAQVAGIDYRTLCLWIAADGLRRAGERRNG